MGGTAAAATAAATARHTRSPSHLHQALVFRVLGVGFRVSGFGFRVSVFGFRVSGFGFSVSGLALGVYGVGLRVSHPPPAREPTPLVATARAACSSVWGLGTSLQKQEHEYRKRDSYLLERPAYPPLARPSRYQVNILVSGRPPPRPLLRFAVRAG